jgi:hypothetical protein
MSERFFRSRDGRFVFNADNVVASALMTPVVVIDPEDAEQVGRLAGILHDFDAHLADDPHRESAWISLTRDALRVFANPTPPKPVEPTGLGAVVEDAEGLLWVRAGTYHQGRGRDWHLLGDTDYECWADVNAVRVLSDGYEVTP